MFAQFSLLHIRILEYAMCPEVLWLLMSPSTWGSGAQGLWALALETDHLGLTHCSANLQGRQY